MTRKDFEFMAATLAAIGNKVERLAMAENFSVIAATSNRLFDKPKFFAACGLTLAPVPARVPLTMPQIRAASLEGGSPFFSRRTMKMFKETAKSYRAGEMLPDGAQLFYREQSASGPATFVFTPAGRINKVRE